MRAGADRSDWLKGLAGCQLDTWRLEKYVGTGKVGSVYRASSTQVPNWEVAVKIFLRDPKPGWEHELVKVSQLRGVDGVPAFHQLHTQVLTYGGRTERLVYTVWDFIPPGKSLRDHLREGAPCSASFLVAVVETVLRVLNACRARGVSKHGDLHEGNILIGEPDAARLDDALNPRVPVFVSDFGYGTTGAVVQPKDDYLGLAAIATSILRQVDWDRANVDDRRTINAASRLVSKLLEEPSLVDRQDPIEVLRAWRGVRGFADSVAQGDRPTPALLRVPPSGTSAMRVGQFQVSEMLGDRWQLWKELFVFAVPARSRLLEADITTVLTGPRGCGKTMLFRRLSERVVLECGPIDSRPELPPIIAFYVNANDIADAFATFSETPTEQDRRLLLCYANLCFLSEVLGVVAAYNRLGREAASPRWTEHLNEWLGPQPSAALLFFESGIDHWRHQLEKLKSCFPTRELTPLQHAIQHLGRHDWIKELVFTLRANTTFTEARNILFLVDDFTTPRISEPMQIILNRVLFQRAGDFVFKIATEASTTFVSVDSSAKVLQDGDDYLLIDMGEESLFMSETERLAFLKEIFRKRLLLDQRVPRDRTELPTLLGLLGMSKTEFARQLRGEPQGEAGQRSKTRRGRAKPKVLYFGADVFSCLWSGDTRLMIQLMQDLVEEGLRDDGLRQEVRAEVQDRVYRNRGGAWLDVQERNQPTRPPLVDFLVSRRPGFRWTGGNYGAHLRAIVEAFKGAARQLLLGPVYVEEVDGRRREVPRMAFRIEVTDRFRLDELEGEIYRDLVRYGILLRDNRGKSVQGAMVPRLFLRRLLLPYCVLPLSRRDSVQMTCEWFRLLLTAPDTFATDWMQYRPSGSGPPGQLHIFGDDRSLAMEESDDFPDDSGSLGDAN